MSTISVIVPNYNRADLIGETLECLVRQTRPADELIVVDDGSTDTSVEVIRSFGHRVRLVQQANAGPAAARNRGLAEASGEFVQFFDSDDLCSLNKLEVQARALEESGADIAYCPWLQTRLADGVARHPELALQQRPLPAGRSALSWYLRGWVTVFQTCLVRRSLIDRAGHYREDLIVAEDSELLFRLLRLSPLLIHTPAALVLYRLHDAQISRGDAARRTQTENLVKLADALLAQIAANPSGTSPAEVDIWRYHRWGQQRILHAIDGSLPPPAAVGPMRRLDYAWRELSTRMRRGLTRRLSGTSYNRPYAPGPLSGDQVALSRALGYEPELSGWCSG